MFNTWIRRCSGLQPQMLRVNDAYAAACDQTSSHRGLFYQSNIHLLWRVVIKNFAALVLSLLSFSFDSYFKALLQCCSSWLGLKWKWERWVLCPWNWMLCLHAVSPEGCVYMIWEIWALLWRGSGSNKMGTWDADEVGEAISSECEVVRAGGV